MRQLKPSEIWAFKNMVMFILVTSHASQFSHICMMKGFISCYNLFDIRNHWYSTSLHIFKNFLCLHIQQEKDVHLSSSRTLLLDCKMHDNTPSNNYFMRSITLSNQWQVHIIFITNVQHNAWAPNKSQITFELRAYFFAHTNEHKSSISPKWY
jgi:hypothetical protein